MEHIIASMFATAAVMVVAVVDFFAEESYEELWALLFDDWCALVAGVFALLMTIVTVWHRYFG